MHHNETWFRNRLHELQKTQADMGRAMPGSSDRATISRIISGERPIKLSELAPLCAFFSCPTEELLHHAGVNVVAYADQSQSEDQDEHRTEILEVNMKAGLGGGGLPELINFTDSNGQTYEIEELRDRWGLPSGYTRQELHVTAKSARIIEVQGDSMEPTLYTGDRVMIDCNQRSPTPPGLFALFDGIGVIVKRLEHIMNSDPTAINIMSDNHRHADVEEMLEQIHIIGRIVWVARKF